MTGRVSGTVLITGATGALGPAVVRAFDAAGWRIRTLSRRRPAAGTPAAEHQHFSGEIDDPGLLRRAMQQADVVVHMAALLHIADPPAALEAEYRRINVHGTEAVMAAAEASGVQRVVALSSIAVYGASGESLDEDAPARPDTLYGATKLEAERRLLARGRGIPSGCVLRLAAVYGPSIKGNYERLARAMARGRFLPIGSGRNARTLVYEDDAAQAMLLAAVHPAAAGSVFNVSDGTVHTVAEILDAISRALGRRPPRLAVPLWSARLAVQSAEAVFGLMGRRSPVTTSALDKYTENNVVSGDRIRRQLGFEPRWALADGWRHTVEKMREEGRL